MIDLVIDLLPTLRITDLLDLALVATLLFVLLLALKRRTTSVVVGLRHARE